MRFLLLLLLMPCISFSQPQNNVNPEFEQMQRIADSTHFPSPFVYVYNDTVLYTAKQIFMMISKWVADSLNTKGAYANNNKIKSERDKWISATVINRLGIAQTLTINIEDSFYSVRFDNGRLRENQSSGLQHIDDIKDSQSLRFGKYYTARENAEYFQSLKSYLRNNGPQ